MAAGLKIWGGNPRHPCHGIINLTFWFAFPFVLLLAVLPPGPLQPHCVSDCLYLFFQLFVVVCSICLINVFHWFFISHTLLQTYIVQQSPFWQNESLELNYKVFCDKLTLDKKDTFECTHWFWTVYSVWLSPSEQASEQSFELWSLYRLCMYTLEL